MEKNEIIFENVVENISDGILTVGLDGTIHLANPSATSILGLTEEQLVGHKLAKLLMENDTNDDFFQCLLDAVYSKQTIMQMVPYDCHGEKKRLRVVSSLLSLGEEKVGLIVTFSDLTNLVQLSEKNEALNRKLTEILDRFVQVMVGAIEARTPYNAHHTKNMVLYGQRYLEYLEKVRGKDVEELRKPFLASIWLHDIGKLVVPRSVMDKATRLGRAEKEIEYRIEIAILREKLLMAQDPSKEESAKAQIGLLAEAAEWVSAINGAGYLGPDKQELLEKLKKIQCLTEDGEYVPLLSEDEIEALSIKKGTLTGAERSVVESHVVHTWEMLEQMGFSGEYEKVRDWAGGHHEYLDGSGYPRGLKGSEIPWETRLLTILDIYDSLTADDRPYKPSVMPQKAFQILENMCEEGKLDKEILNDFISSKAWEPKNIQEEKGNEN